MKEGLTSQTIIAMTSRISLRDRDESIGPIVKLKVSFVFWTIGVTATTGPMLISNNLNVALIQVVQPEVVQVSLLRSSSL
jgi:hypothetical protein